MNIRLYALLYLVYHVATVNRNILPTRKTILEAAPSGDYHLAVVTAEDHKLSETDESELK